MKPKPATRLRKVWVISLLVILPFISRAQRMIEEKLLRRLEAAGSDSERVIRIGPVADYYYANKDFEKADSLIEKQIMWAESTLSPSLSLLAYFGNAGYRSTGTSTRNRSKNTREYIERAIEYARLHNRNDYAAMGYANLSALNMTDGLTEEGFRNANLAFTMALNTDNDSAKVICAIQLGNTYLKRSDILMAFRTYTNAGTIAGKREDEALSPPVWNAVAGLYKRLGKDEIAKSYVFRSLAINKKRKNISGQAGDYIFLAVLSNYHAGKEYLQLALQLADSAYQVPLLIDAEKILFSHMLLQETPAYMLAYLDAQPELKNVFRHTGPGYLDWMTAEIYLYGHRPDSARYYFDRAEEAFNTGYDLTTKKNFFGEYAACLQELKLVAPAIQYYRKSYDLAREAADLPALQHNSGALRSLYEQLGDFRQAYDYSREYEHFKDSVDLLGRERDLALLEISNEEREQAKLAELAARDLQRRHNLQYMFITIVIATAFVLIIMIGMFRVSAFTIRLMGFLSLIFFFEFIILLLDTKIHHLTHGEPWKIWLIKIGIISILLPVHHFLEHKLIHYLMSRHLLKLRSKLSLATLFKKKKKSLPVTPAEGREKQDPENKS